MPALRTRWSRLLALLGALACLPVWPVEEQELKAAIVFNLLLFTEWPVDAAPAGTGALVLCVSPSSALNTALKALKGREVRSQRLDVRDLPAGASSAACQAVYVDAGDAARPPAATQPTGRAATLVISDDMAAAPPSAAIVLRRVGTRIGFDVNLVAARQARLQFSSKLLRLAHAVKE